MRNKNLIDILLTLLTLVLIALQLSGCVAAKPTATSTNEPAPLAEPLLRIQNTSDREIKNLTVLFPDSRISFGTVAANSTTEYLPAPKGVYNYAAYEYELNGQVVTQPVIDWMGESPRPGQSYTYVIEFDPSGSTMQSIILKEVLVP